MSEKAGHAPYQQQPQVDYGQPPVYGQPQPGYGQAQPMYPAAQYAGGPPMTTTVIMQQPGATRPMGVPRVWATDLMSCMDDMEICLCGAFCGLCLACQVATDMGESGCVPCCVPAADVVLRVKWRTQENIEGSIMDDCLTQMCCGPCGMCQLAREVKLKKNGITH